MLVSSLPCLISCTSGVEATAGYNHGGSFGIKVSRAGYLEQQTNDGVVKLAGQEDKRICTRAQVLAREIVTHKIYHSP